MKYYTGEDVLRVLYAQAVSPDAVASVEREMTQLLKSRHPLDAEYDVQTLVAILGAARAISLALTVVLLVIAAIALLISGIGIMNIMLVTVKERTREIGIRKAIGAAHKEILYQFLIEAFLISGGGAVLGILIGLAIPVSIQPLIAGKSARSCFLDERDRRFRGVVLDGTFLRIFAGQPGGQTAADRVVAL